MFLLDFLQYQFFVRALVVGGLLSVVLSWLSGYVVMRREVLLTHSISHVALLGVAVALFLEMDVLGGILTAALLGGFFLSYLKEHSGINSDSLLEIFAQAALALGVILIALVPGYQVDMEQFLFGDVLAISATDVWVTGILAVIVAGLVSLFHKNFLRISLSGTLSQVIVRRKKMWEALLLVMIALSIGMAMKVVGILLVASFVTIPANIAKNLARSLSQTFVISVFVGFLMTVIGLFASAALDIPSGPSIVMMMVFCLIVVRILKR